MNNLTNSINKRMSLRVPQKESLEILDKIVNTIGLNPKVSVSLSLEKIQSLKLPKFSEFERDFPNFAFALATGVGKTRLMGASIAYLFLKHGIRDFLILAPNLTIYNKLIGEFSNSSHPKYVFKGISEFVHSPPQIITGDNYHLKNTSHKIQLNKAQTTIFEEEVFINIFNISKINADSKNNKTPRIKKLSEYLGESYFQYLQNIEKLVILMDEAHQYRAVRGLSVINELKPVLGLEFTATAKTIQAGKATPFKNVVYDYSLGHAIEDGFVKIPAVATRGNLTSHQFKKMTPTELDQLKLNDALWVHQNTKTKLLKYAKDNLCPIIKPFVLVIAKNIEHADEIETYIKSPDFYHGHYAESVITVHSNMKGIEQDENIEFLLSLEKENNPIEIVIHVNMLKEGWDVTNLYTLVPLRAMASDILTEQTLGRGLRLPYGNRTGDDAVDKLTIIAHDRFEELIEASKNEDSIILKQEIIEGQDINHDLDQDIITIPSRIQEMHHNNEDSEFDKQIKKVTLDGIHYGRIDLKAKDKELENFLKENLPSNPQKNSKEKILNIAQNYIKDIRNLSIAIPRINIHPCEGAIKSGIHHFKLETKNIPKFHPIHDEILIRNLKDGMSKTLDLKEQNITSKVNDQIIIKKILEHDEIDYQDSKEILYSLAHDLIHYLKSYLNDDDDVANIVLTQTDKLANILWEQIEKHFYCEVLEYDRPMVLPFSEILSHHYGRNANTPLCDYKKNIKSQAELKKTIFQGFKKSCHSYYKFDTFGEQKFSQILEHDNDKNILKWLRPSPRQFQINWSKKGQNYEPDFIVETTNAIFMIEIKAKDEIENHETQEKKKAALEYCHHATRYNLENSGKPWHYVLIPDAEISLARDFVFYTKTYICN